VQENNLIFILIILVSKEKLKNLKIKKEKLKIDPGIS